MLKGVKDGSHRYYNFYGIGAFDENAVHTGKSYAKQQSWTTPSKAIMGGASFVRNHYFENNQLNLYQMRWNPQNPGQHQYASDIKWVDNIADMMKNIMTTLVLKRKYTKKIL